MSQQRCIALFGGTFDPVHYGHLYTARALLQKLPLNELRMLPCAEPVHRAKPLASGPQRLQMLRLAVQEFPELIVDDSELCRGGPSYTWDTLRRLRQQSDARLCLVMGLDAFQTFTSWYAWRKILQFAHLLVVSRPDVRLAPGSEAQQLLQRYALNEAQALYLRPAGGVLLLDLPPYEISSTQIRARLTRGESVQGLMPTSVIAWIDAHKLYFETQLIKVEE